MYKLLIADDEYEIRNGLFSFFPWNTVGFDAVGQVSNGQEAYDYICANAIDILLCDIKMPVMSGLELAKVLFEEKNPVKIVFLSAYKDFEYAKAAMEYNVRGYILKSSNYNELITAFNKLRLELDNDIVPTVNIPYEEKIIELIKTYVLKNLKTVTLDDIADVVHMNPDYISKYFRKKTGEHFSDYLISVRMEKAKELLNDIRLKTYNISELVGYSSSFNFTRAFKRHFGITPREYRQNKSVLYNETRD